MSKYRIGRLGACAAGCLATCLLPVAAAASPELSGAWVRALPPSQSLTAAYLSVHNPGTEAVVVVGARADVAGSVEIHTTREVDGMVRMEQLEELRVAPGGDVALEPGGAHLMLLDLARMPAPGEEVRLCLQLASGGEVCTVATARKSAAPDRGAHDHH